MTKNPPHILATQLRELLLRRLVPVSNFPTMGNPVSIPERDREPEPDAQVVRGTPCDYAGRKQGPANAALVIEVSDPGNSYDRRARLEMSAAAGLPVDWIRDHNRRRLEVFADPASEGEAATDRDQRAYGPDDKGPLVLDRRGAAEIFVRNILL